MERESWRIDAGEVKENIPWKMMRILCAGRVRRRNKFDTFIKTHITLGSLHPNLSNELYYPPRYRHVCVSIFSTIGTYRLAMLRLYGQLLTQHAGLADISDSKHGSDVACSASAEIPRDSSWRSKTVYERRLAWKF
jgi:hypothetical protein